ncbi:MAG: HDOD domain-containing protein [Myxococcota bacterium]|nr:HDOD domain-containing protein [Myxococcota bacterium]
MSWLNDLFGSSNGAGSASAAQSPRSAPSAAAPDLQVVRRAHVPSPELDAFMGTPEDPNWVRGRSAPSVETDAVRAGLVVTLASIHEECAPGERDLVAALMASLELGDLGLPPFPDTVIELRRLLDSDRVDSAEVSRLVRSDPGLAEEIWRVSSSVAHGGKRPPTLQAGIIRLGHQQLWKIAMYVALDEALFRISGYEEEVLYLRKHGSQVADLAEWLAPTRLAGDAWLAGLLHDSGKLLVCRQASELRVPSSSPILRTLIDRTHAGFGAMVANSWGLEGPAEAIAQHHGGGSPIADMVHCADVAAHGASFASRGLSAQSALDTLKQFPEAVPDPIALLDKAITLVEQQSAA